MFITKRVYDDSPDPEGAPRFLVERLWPRGIRKEALGSAVWLKDVAPSPELRKWFGHDPAKWEEFRRRYFTELDSRPEAVEPLLSAGRRSDVVLLYSAHDTEHNNAVALEEYLERRLSGSGTQGSR